MLYAAIALTPAARNGKSSSATPYRFSLYASDYFAGWNALAWNGDSG